jgi:nitroimidazol reductase NimA-like FMN-containing flavoprotein (pyridoxamine 5'-phosphate oxidase superfamily)
MAISPIGTPEMAVELAAPPRLSPQRCRDLLGEARDGYLALSRGALPVVVPVTCALGVESLLVRAGPGSLEGFVSQPGVVAFGTSIPGVDQTSRFEVLVQGRAELVSDPVTGSPPRFPLVDNSLTIVFRVTLELVTGWQFGPAA